MNFGNGAESLYNSISSQVSSGRPANATVATTHSRFLLKENTDQIKKCGRLTIFGLINASRLPNGQCLKLRTHAPLERSTSAVASQTTLSIAVAATWTSADDATSISMMSSSCTTSSFIAQASMIYSTCNLDHFMF